MGIRYCDHKFKESKKQVEKIVIKVQIIDINYEINILLNIE